MAASCVWHINGAARLNADPRLALSLVEPLAQKILDRIADREEKLSVPPVEFRITSPNLG